MSDILEVWADTGETVKREATAEELTQLKNDRIAYEKLQKELAASLEADRTAREAAIEHAKSLGFTDQMIAVMYPNLGAQA